MHVTISRRALLQSGLAGAVIAATGIQLQAAEPPLAIIDTHQHLWDLTKIKLRWMKPEHPLNHNYTLADYQEAAAGLNIVQTVYMEVDAAPDQKQAEADAVIELCRNARETKLVAAVVGANMRGDDFAKYVRQFAKHPFVKGVRQVMPVPTVADGESLDKSFVQNVQLLGELGLSFDLCGPPDKLADTAKLVAACPDTRFILDHCGNANVQAPNQEAWKRGLAAVAKHERVMCKISGIVANAGKNWTAEDLAPIVDFVYEQFGADRVMFAGDWPVCTKTATLAQWVAALKSIVRSRPHTAQEKLFYDNAVKYYELVRA